GFPTHSENSLINDYGETHDKLEASPDGKTWTLVILSDLKPVGRQLKSGHLIRMLEAALHLGSDMGIYINGERLTSSKIDTEVLDQWIIGPELEIDSIEIENPSWKKGDPEKDKVKTVKISSSVNPSPHCVIP